jgi:hypothetical protein
MAVCGQVRAGDEHIGSEWLYEVGTNVVAKVAHVYVEPSSE